MRLFKIKKTDFFLIFVYFNIFCKGIGLGNDSLFYKSLIVVGVIALFYKIVDEKYRRKEMKFIVILCMIGFSSFLAVGKPTLLLSCMCIVGMKNIDIDKLFKGMFNIRAITFIGIVTLSLLGIIENQSIEMWRSGGFDVRYSLGFGHPNTLHLSLFILVSLYFYVRYERLNVLDYLLVSIVNLFIYSYSLSRTGCVVVFIVLILMVISKIRICSIRKLIIKSPKYIFLLLCIISFLFAYLYGKSALVTALDIPFNGRLRYSNYYILNYGLTLFGNNITGDINALFDNGYLYLYIQFGLLGLILISNLILLACKYAEKTNNVCQSVIIISYLIYIFTESFTPNIFMNNMLFFAIPMIYGNRNKRVVTNG